MQCVAQYALRINIVNKLSFFVSGLFLLPFAHMYIAVSILFAAILFAISIHVHSTAWPVYHVLIRQYACCVYFTFVT